jgi:DNA-binding response OmpR family regulator
MAFRDPLHEGSDLYMLEPDRLSAARSVLLVEDDELVQSRLESLLAPAGYSVTCVATIREACAAVAPISFQIVIIDRSLPDGDGAAFCAELNAHRHRSRVFVLMLSGRDSSHDIAVGLRAGADVYLSKRASNAELLAYLDAASAVAQFAAGVQHAAARSKNVC